MGSRKNFTCVGKTSGLPVTEHDSLEEAWQGQARPERPGHIA